MSEAEGAKAPAVWMVERDGSYLSDPFKPPAWVGRDKAYLFVDNGEDTDGWVVHVADQVGGRAVAVETDDVFTLFRLWRQAAAGAARAEAEEEEARKEAVAARGRARAAAQAFALAAMADVPREDRHRGRGGWYAIGDDLVYLDESGNEHDGFRYDIRPAKVTRIRPQA